MGRKGGSSWLDVVKKAFTSPTKHTTKMIKARRREDHEPDVHEDKKRSKRRWIFKKPVLQETTMILHHESNNLSTIDDSIHGGGPSDTNSVSEAAYSDQKHAMAVSEAAVEVIRLTRPTFSLEKHNAALVIQTSFRGYLARRALQALKGVVKLQALVRGHNVRKRAKMTLKCMQALVRVQARVCDQRKKLSNEGSLEDSAFSDSNSIRGSHLADHKSINTREESNINTDEWDEHAYRIEEIQAMLQKTQVAAQNRERDLTNAFIHQIWRSSQNEYHEENWKWDRKFSPDQRDPVKTVTIDTAERYFSSPSCQRSPNQSYCYQQQKLNSNPVSSPPHRPFQNLYPQSPITPSSLSRIKPSVQAHSTSPWSQRGERNYSTPGTATGTPSYMAATASAMARVRTQSAPRQRVWTTEGEKKLSAKKRLSFNVSEKYNSGGVSDSELDHNLRSPTHMMERRLSMSSCCKERNEEEISRPSVSEDRKWFR